MNENSIKATLVLLLFSTVVHAQKISAAKVPAQINASFNKIHPEIGKVTWELENGSYEAEFVKNGVKISELYSKSGMLRETETAIKISSLPVGILPYVKQHYKRVSIVDAAKITDNNGVVKYEAAIKGKDLIFDERGHFIKEIKD